MHDGPLFRRLTLPALLVSLALMLSAVERLFSLDLLLPVPGLRLGLPNIVTLFALWALPAKTALLILVLRCVLASLFGGGASALIFSLSGGLLAFVVMWALFPLEGKGLSAAGISVAGAAAHNVGQLLAARVVMGAAAVFGYLPFLLLGSVLSGLATGAAFLAMRPALLRTPWMQALQREKHRP